MKEECQQCLVKSSHPKDEGMDFVRVAEILISVFGGVIVGIFLKIWVG